jgi:hypothetical protein
MSLDGIWPHTGGLTASPSPHLTSSPPTRRPSIQNPQPPSPAVQSSAIHFRSPHSRIAPAPNERRKGVAPDSRTSVRNHSRVPAGPSLLALLWPFFFLPTGGGRLEKVDFGDICDTCVLTGNRAVGELLREIRKNRPCHRRVVIIVTRPVLSNPASSGLSTHR